MRSHGGLSSFGPGLRRLDANDGFARADPLRGVLWNSPLPRALIAFLSIAAVGCERPVSIGERMCSIPPVEGGAVPDPDASVGVPWSTGFEDGFCEYAQPTGFCFSTGVGSYALVTSPVHSGRYAAAFQVASNVDGGSQTRCVQQGVFPSAAYYGAWYFVPAASLNSGNWNLLHFQGASAGQALHALWDVSLGNVNDGGVQTTLYLYDFGRGGTVGAGQAPPIPIGQWFHIEVYFKRAKDTTGMISLWQDGVFVSQLSGFASDDTDWGQWYIGNLANSLSPPASTVYVDDVTIGSTP